VVSKSPLRPNFGVGANPHPDQSLKCVYETGSGKMEKSLSIVTAE